MAEMELKMKASDLAKMLAKMSARVSNGKIQFNPLKIVAQTEKEGTITLVTMMNNVNKSASMVAKFSGIEGTKFKGTKSFCLDVDVVVDYTEDLYGGDETLTVRVEDDRVYVLNENAELVKKCWYWREDESVVHALDKFPVTLKNGMVFYEKGTMKPETEIIIDTAELVSVIKLRGSVRKHTKDGSKQSAGPNFYHFKFSEKKSQAIIGDKDDKTISPIEMDLNCKVQGPDAEVIIGTEEFEHVIGVHSGEIKIYVKSGYPIWIVVVGENFNAGYLIAPKAEEPEIGVEVTESGDVEMIEDNDGIPENIGDIVEGEASED